MVVWQCPLQSYQLPITSQVLPFYGNIDFIRADIEQTYSPGFHVAAKGLQLAKTNVRPRIAIITMTITLNDIGYLTRLRRSKRMQAKPMAHFTIVDEIK